MVVTWRLQLDSAVIAFLSFSTKQIDKQDQLWLMEIVTKEVPDVSTTKGRQPRTGAILVRADRDGLDTGLHDGPGLRGAARGGRSATHQRGGGHASRCALRTGFVASGKIINLHIPQLYSIVRGKVGRAVEFGLSWGITRLKGGFVLATVASAKKDFTDTTFAVPAVEQVAALCGKAPRSYAYDRAGHSSRVV